MHQHLSGYCLHITFHFRTFIWQMPGIEAGAGCALPWLYGPLLHCFQKAHPRLMQTCCLISKHSTSHHVAATPAPCPERVFFFPPVLACQVACFNTAMLPVGVWLLRLKLTGATGSFSKSGCLMGSLTTTEHPVRRRKLTPRAEDQDFLLSVAGKRGCS